MPDDEFKIRLAETLAELAGASDERVAEIDRSRRAMDFPTPEGATGEPGFIAAIGPRITWASQRAEEIARGRLHGLLLARLIPLELRGRHDASHLDHDAGYPEGLHRGVLQCRDQSQRPVVYVIFGGLDQEGCLCKIWEQEEEGG